MKKNKKVQTGVIKTQIFAMSMLSIILILLGIGAFFTKETWIIITFIIYSVEYTLMLLHEINIIKEAAGHKVKKNPIYMWLFILILILTFLFISIFALIDKTSIKSNSIKTEATIYKIDKEVTYKTEYDEDGNSYEVEEKKCTKHITYIVDNKEYKGVMSEVTCRKHEKNDKVTIYYDKDNPENFIELGDIFFTWLGIVISVVALIAFIASTINSCKKTKKSKPKKKKGISITFE